MVQSTMSFLIVVCGNCSRFLLAKAEQKTRTCPYCGFKVVLSEAKKLASAENAYDASMILRKLKDDSVLKRKTSKHP